jgi:hypothetical protein
MSMKAAFDLVAHEHWQTEGMCLIVDNPTPWCPVLAAYRSSGLEDGVLAAGTIVKTR